MIRWYNKLYTDTLAGKKQKKIRKIIEAGKVSVGVYVIAFASNSQNLFDIFSANELLFPHMKRMDHDIIGIAYTREGAIYLLQEIIEEIYHNTGGLDARSYLKFDEY
ncbi:hypothetical protein [Anaeromicropila herbilytica]|uniref:Uncharacterized protein n=1 Tax=Anaeromicropila herbilytica TaxID=2785025 RepID=A0A7R7EKL4_9FIRM|nr:hypothetical protein [Anaeromicropila herbilytica]BCN30464.1 hypothetical protein bsdtb5_17590 [Anaeromicropila herbilytica]